MKVRFALLAAAMPLLAAYTYFYTDTLASINSTYWYSNGSFTTGSSGLNTSGSNGGTVISKVAIPDGSANYEVKAKLRLTQDGGNYTLYLRASNDAWLASPATGSFYAVELQNPVFTNGICSATLALYKQVSGSLTQMTNTQTTCHDNLELHAVIGGPQVIVYADNVELMWVWDSSLTTGKGGVGGRGMPAGNSIAQVDLGRLDMTGPNAIVPSSVSSSIFPDRADLAWQGVVDDSNGVGLFGYLCYLNNNFVGMRRTPDVSLVTLSPSTAYNLICYPEDFHGSTGSPLVLNFNTPAAGAIDPRRTGVHALGTHWGGMGENIDLQSGNLNFSIPLLKAQGRGGWGATAALSYNSQQWRKDVLNSGTNYWKLGADTGTGFGWTVQFGSITPFYSDYWTVHHWTFVDAQGTSYKLDINNSGQWTSKEGVFVTWDAARRKLFFPDGSFWFFDCVAAGTEPDAGTQYPTLMQDTNGNQIVVRYKAGMELSYQNSSSRIWEIEDVRATGQSTGRYTTYQFCYDDQALYYCDYPVSGGSAIHHLQKIQNFIGTGEGFTFTYNSNVTLADPYASQSFGTVSTLHSITSTNNLQHLMTHNSAGELTQITYPYGGTFVWNYAAKELKGRFMREVTSRVLNAQDGNGNLTYSLYRDDAGDAQRFAHTFMVVADASNKADKAYFFETYPYWGMGLLKYLYERDLTGGGDKRITIPTWSQTANGTPFVSASEEILDPATANVHSKVEQEIDNNGNQKFLKLYQYWTASATPVLARTYTYNYLTGTNYTSRNILNRLTSVTVQKPGGNTITLVTNTYDGGSLTTLGSTPRGWDPSVAIYRGNITRSVTPGGPKNTAYFSTGAAYIISDDYGHSVSTSTGSSTNYAVPSAITAGSLTSSYSWNSFLGLTQSTSPNSATSSYSFDSYGRPAQTNHVTGEVVTTTYTNSPPTQTTTTGTRWTKSTFDGLGRTLKVETGYNTGSTPTTVSVVDRVYTPCACTPIGKIWKESLPHVSGAGTVYWTEHIYDALGRTVQVKQPNNSGTATYSYSGNTVTSTDAAGKWKTFESDAMGNLAKVTEPNPAGSANLETSYTYSEVKQLLTVSMPRSGVTQTRNFVYNSSTQRLTSVTNPENGTTTNYYNNDGTLAYKIDAKGQKISYDYDSLMRVTAVHRYPNGSTEDTNQLTNFEYDGNSVASGFSQNVSGRLGVATSRIMNTVGGVTSLTTFYEMYSYDPGGRIVKKRLRVSRSNLNDVDKDLEYAYTGAQLNTVKYPDVNVPYTYFYDNMLRPNRMTGKDPNDYQTGTNTIDYVNSVSYNVAARMTAYRSVNGATYANHTFTYNERNEMTRQQSQLDYGGGSLADIQYEYSSSSDNGQILSRTNNISAEKVTYQYDALKRLIGASATNTGNSSTIWASTYGYDGFGNLLSKTPTAGSAPNLSVTVNSATNRISSGGYYYDPNGNMTSAGGFDVDNRLVAAGGEEYAYLTSNQRIYKKDASGNEWIYLHDANGKRLVQYQIFIGGGGMTLGSASNNVYFAGRPISLNGTSVVTDRLGSVVSRGGTAVDYFPFGEEKATSANPAEKFGTYLRDATGLDYADQRHYGSTVGRFTASDPYQASGGVGDPGSWNRYSYALSDPINKNDSSGLLAENVHDQTLIDQIFSPAMDPVVTGQSETSWPPYVRLQSISNPFPYNCVTWECYEVEVVLTDEAYEFLLSQNLIQGAPLPTLPPIRIGPNGSAGNNRITMIAILAERLFNYWNQKRKLMPSDCPPGEREGTPSNPKPDQTFEPVRGQPCKLNPQTGEIWCKDTSHGDHWEVYKSKKDQEKNNRTRSVWDNGCVRERF